MPSYNQILIVGDFNIHVCWPSDPLTRDFLSLIDSFSLARFVSGPTPETGSHVGSRVAVFSDRCPGVFGIVSSYHIVVLCLNPLHLNHFLFKKKLLSSPLSLGTEEMTSRFYHKYKTVRDDIPTFKTTSLKPQSDPWINDAPPSAR